MILLLDNYDSFVHNLARYFRQLGCQARVIRSDQIDAATCAGLAPEAIVISPGPRRPANAGCSVDVIQRLSGEIPMLGVCLGHQAIGVAFGATVGPCGPMHGMSSKVVHNQRELFEGCPLPLSVGRYHSLAIEEDRFPSELEITARSDDGVIMGVRHRSRPVYGVQFHPESVLTDGGSRILRNFLALLRRPTHNPRKELAS